MEVFILFDDRLRKLRTLKNLNMKQVANALNIPYTTYVGYEKNDREPNSDILVLIADFFNCSVDYLIGRSEVLDINYSENINNNLLLTDHETKIITEYRTQKDMQKAVDRLLKIENTYQQTTKFLKAARSKDNSEPVGTIELTAEQIERIHNAPTVTDEDL